MDNRITSVLLTTPESRFSSGVKQVVLRKPSNLIFLPVELLDKIVGWVALSSVRLEDDGLVAFASICKRCREVVLGWLATARACEIFQVGTGLSPLMAGFLVHKPNVLKQLPNPLMVEGELAGQDWGELMVKSFPLAERWRWSLKLATREVWPASQTSLHMLRCYCLSDDCECLEVEHDCDKKATGLRCSASFNVRAGYDEEVLRDMLREGIVAACESGVSRRWVLLYERLYKQLQMGSFTS